MHLHHGTIFCAIALLALALGGCTDTPPTRTYVISAMADRTAPVPGKGIGVGIGPVTLPQYLDRPEIVTRSGANRLQVAEFDQWGGDLDDNVTRVLAANLSDLLETDRVSLYPWKDDAPIDYQVTIDVATFEQGADGSSVLSAYWSLVDPRDGTVMLMRRSTYRDAGGADQSAAAGNASAGDRPYDAVAAAMSRNLEALSRDIAGAIGSLRAS